jgi:3-hydroxyisobutyrate dehydrogenase-like beta-hydroxyacid dehydrogenase
VSTIAFFGLGIMGAPMSEHLIKAGHTVTGFNRSRSPVDRLGLAGNRILERKAANMLAGNFEPGLRIDLHHKGWAL